MSALNPPTFDWRNPRMDEWKYVRADGKIVGEVHNLLNGDYVAYAKGKTLGAYIDLTSAQNAVVNAVIGRVTIQVRK